MKRLETTYMGLTLKNPIIVGSSPLTATLDGLKKCEDAGAGAVVVKSIFEEQIEADVKRVVANSDSYSAHTDALDFIAESSRNHYLDAYLELIEKATEALEIPVIASINCTSIGAWTDYIQRFAEVGADALELNQFLLPSSVACDQDEVLEHYLEVVQIARERAKFPLALKMSSQFTALAHVVKTFDSMNLDAVVLFNRFYQPDVNIKKIEVKPSLILSGPNDYFVSLQWTALLSAYLNCDICASTGIHSYETLVKMLLSGAKAVQITSSVMLHGHQIIQKMQDQLLEWMDEHQYHDFIDFRGKLAHKRVDDPTHWERTQYMKSLNVEF